ncbi:MAG TPA: DPP IV N-terminal domain-containing protein, partial [Candidatus Cloacimonadota bacterium]|nr:DPP IV N-terminal domain-containing protein [Candidatus Cloacimonadota bacterium]
MSKQTNGYYRFPTIFKDKVVFVSEDDLWMISTKGGQATRLTANLGEVSRPRFSPDGKYIAFTGREEGNSEIYVMPSEGGQATRLTWQGAACATIGWRNDKIIYSSNANQAISRQMVLFEIPRNGGYPKALPYGPASQISIHEKGTVLGRNTEDLARWKRYRGGTAGEILIDNGNTGKFKVLVDLKSNLSTPMWIGDRIY